MSWVNVYIFSFIPLFIIDLCKDIKLSMTTQIAIMFFMLVYFVGLIIFIKIFINPMSVFTELLVEKIYFLVYTIKGKAICKNDFNVIKGEYEEFREEQKPELAKWSVNNNCSVFWGVNEEDA